MPKATVNGVSLHYEEAGKGHPLLLLHPYPIHHGIWKPQMEFFARHFHVIAYDQRGFGRSEAPEDQEGYSQDISVEDARALLHHLGVPKAAVCGLSMGGSIALNLAISHPANVSALILCGSGSGSDDVVAFRKVCEQWASTAERGNQPLYEYAMQQGLFAEFAKRGKVEADLVRDSLLGHSAKGLAFSARTTMGGRPPVYALEDKLKRLKVPTLVMFGEREVAPVKASRFMADTIPGAKLWTMPGVNHFCNAEDPDLFNQTILSFLRQHHSQ